MVKNQVQDGFSSLLLALWERLFGFLLFGCNHTHRLCLCRLSLQRPHPPFPRPLDPRARCRQTDVAALAATLRLSDPTPRRPRTRGAGTVEVDGHITIAASGRAL